MIAPILLPVLALLSAFNPSPSPVLEWALVEHGRHTCTIDVKLALTGDPDLSKLSLVPRQHDLELNVATTPLDCDDHWVRNNALSWMWNDAPSHIAFEVTMSWTSPNPDPSAPLLDVAWEQIADGNRQKWTLGTVSLPDNAPEPERRDPATWAKRLGERTTDTAADITVSIQDVEPQSFVKLTEYVPSHCTCEVLDAAGASLRRSENAQIFLWFQTNDAPQLLPRYRLTCAEPLSEGAFDGELEVAFGTRTNTSHIAQVEWVGPTPTLNENMELNQSPDVQSVVSNAGAPHSSHTAVPASQAVTFAVQLLANHRDLAPGELAEAIGYKGSYSTTRHDGWHKHLTHEVATYADAHALRSMVWSTTAADDAFVTASLEGERITVQEGLLLLNQTWIP